MHYALGTRLAVSRPPPVPVPYPPYWSCLGTRLNRRPACSLVWQMPNGLADKIKLLDSLSIHLSEVAFTKVRIRGTMSEHYRATCDHAHLESAHIHVHVHVSCMTIYPALYLPWNQALGQFNLTALIMIDLNSCAVCSNTARYSALHYMYIMIKHAL